MSGRPRWFAVLASSLAVLVLALGMAVPEALAKKNPPKNTQLPNGRPFQLIQQMIDALDARLDALESAAPEAGLLWINPLDLRGGPGVALSLESAVSPGLVVAGAAPDVVQAGLQVPPGFAVTGVKVCYVPGVSGSHVSSVQLLQYDVPPTVPTVVLNDPFVAPASTDPLCVDTSTVVSVDPSAGGPLFLSLGLSLSALDSISIRGIGLQIEPAVAGP
jgi:hypothetical protein